MSGKTKTAPQSNSIDSAIEQVRDWEQTEQADEQQRDRHNWDLYVAILLRSDNPQPGDADQLAQMMTDYGLTAEQIEEDRQTIQRALIWTDRLSQVDRLHRESIEATQAYRELMERHKKEEHEAHRKKRNAQNEHQRAVNAPWQLTKLKRQRPELFDDSDPPRLRSS